MKDNFSWLTPKQAADLSDYSARHIQNLIVDGKLSATREDGRYYIERSEFFRVFPAAKRKELSRNIALQESEHARLELENTILKDMASKKEREVEFLRHQIDTATNEKGKMLEAIVNQTRGGPTINVKAPGVGPLNRRISRMPGNLSFNFFI